MSTKFYGHVLGAVMPLDDLYQISKTIFRHIIFSVQPFIVFTLCVSLLWFRHF